MELEDCFECTAAVSTVISLVGGISCLAVAIFGSPTPSQHKLLVIVGAILVNFPCLFWGLCFLLIVLLRWLYEDILDARRFLVSRLCRAKAAADQGCSTTPGEGPQMC